jgi:hypothetical protein
MRALFTSGICHARGPFTSGAAFRDAEWSDSDADLVDRVMEAVVGVEVELEMTRSH